MFLDYQLTRHYDTLEDCHKHKPNCYLIKIFTPRAQDLIKSCFKLDMPLKETVYTTDAVLFKSIYDKLKCFSGLFGDDSWPLYAENNNDYWVAILGDNYLDNYKPYGTDIYNEFNKI